MNHRPDIVDLLITLGIIACLFAVAVAARGL